jgi:hypothetical protein
MALAISDEIKYTLTRSCNSQAQNYYNNNYSLNIEKSLKKKLECTKRSEIQYTATGGGITVELDAVSFELFTSAVELYCRNPNAIKLFDFNKVIAKDKGGRKVQYTFQIFDAPSLSYTINAYITKCSLLINGKNISKFLERDIEYIHEIMCNTTITGEKINTELLNSALCKTLEEAIKSLKTRKLKVESSNNNLTKINKDEKCHKCNRNCKTRAVLCQKGHWIHYACDKLSEIEIELIEKNDQPHICKNCKIDITDIVVYQYLYGHMFL